MGLHLLHHLSFVMNFDLLLSQYILIYDKEKILRNFIFIIFSSLFLQGINISKFKSMTKCGYCVQISDINHNYLSKGRLKELFQMGMFFEIRICVAKNDESSKCFFNRSFCHKSTTKYRD